MDADERTALETVDRVAALARLELPPGDRPELARQFERILAAFRSLSELDVEGVEPMTSPIEASDVLREDRPREFGDEGAVEGSERLLGNAPARQGDFFAVPKTVGGER
jgi:aspartyl-tRNA(Asn)/glutamyl-tRNA(Gln) amidotransferase subunit C